MRTAIASTLFAAAAGTLLLRTVPFPSDDPLVELVELRRPGLHAALRSLHHVLAYLSPGLLAASLISLARARLPGRRGRSVRPLPPLPDPLRSAELEVHVGELHFRRRIAPSPRPRRLTVPERGLYAGIAVFGAVGTGKTSCCMRPFVRTVLGFRAHDPERRAAALVLEVKGDFCDSVRRTLEELGRGGDFVRVGPESDVLYNPLRGGSPPYALAYGLASLLNNLYGRGREPFWQQAYVNLVKFVILLRRLVEGYCTLFDVYAAVIDPDLLASLIERGRRTLLESPGRPEDRVTVPAEVYLDNAALERFDFRTRPDGRLEAPASPDLLRLLDRLGAGTRSAAGRDVGADRRRRFEAVLRWYEGDWMRIEAKLRTSIVEGISVFLSLFDDDPSVKRVFCPPKEVYERPPSDGTRVLRSFDESIGRGEVVALDFPFGANPGLAKAVGVMMKLDWQRAVLARIPSVESGAPGAARPVLFCCDEYQSFATAGENDPTGDEKFFSLSRQARCIPLVASQSLSSLRSALPGESWRTLLQAFRTKIFLALSDDFSCRIASEMCGREDAVTPQLSVSESAQNPSLSPLGGRPGGERGSLTASKSFSLRRRPVFEPKAFAELPDAASIVLAYDGADPRPATLCFLKPDYRDPALTYFEQRERTEGRKRNERRGRK